MVRASRGVVSWAERSEGGRLDEGAGIIARDQVVGLNVKNLLDYVEATHGKKALEDVLAGLPPAARTRFTDRILVSDWYPMTDHLALYSAICRGLYGGDVEIGFDVGRQMAKRRITIFQRMFLLFRDPAFVIARSTTAWSLFYRPSRMEHEFTGTGRARARIVGMDARPADRFFCNVLAAHLQTFAEAGGARSIVLRHPECRSEGAPCCEFEGSWT